MGIRGAAVSVVVLTTLMAGCGSKDASSPASSSSSSSSSSASSSSAATTSTAPPASKAYTLGLQQVAKQAFDQYTGTGTAWAQACQNVVNEWEGAVGTQPWWNREQVVKGCMDKPDVPVATQPTDSPKQCDPKDQFKISVYNGALTCSDASVIAARYDLRGDKLQQIDSVDTWNCAAGVESTKPVIFTCFSDRGADFAVFPAS